MYLLIARREKNVLVLDALCQDFVGLAFIARVLSPRIVDASIVWRIAPSFPQSGGGGLSLSATF